MGCVYSKMRYFIYYCNECDSAEDDFLTSVGTVQVDGSDKNSRIRAVVGWLLDKIMKRSVHIPYFIEVSIQEHFKKEKELCIPEAFVDEADVMEFQKAIDRIMESEYLMKTFYTRWTEEETMPLVVVAESDVAAEFILRRFPPVEYYAHVREGWEGEEGGGEGGDEEDGEDDGGCVGGS